MEIAASSAAIDTGSKKQAYRRNGVSEYIIWQSFENQLDWYSLQAEEYRLLPVNEQGIICSERFPGLSRWTLKNTTKFKNVNNLKALLYKDFEHFTKFYIVQFNFAYLLMVSGRCTVE